MRRLPVILALALTALITAGACSDGNAPKATPTSQAERPGAGAIPRVERRDTTPGAGVRLAPLQAPVCSTVSTPAQAERPYFKAGSPERSYLIETGMAGTKLTLTGFVVTKSCKPVTNATLEFWQADAAGVYDNAGYRLRGHYPTDDRGAFTLETIVPGEYPGRTEHIHFKVIVPGRPTLTSQFYFPDARRNTSDGIFDAKLLLSVTERAGGVEATYTIVLDMP